MGGREQRSAMQAGWAGMAGTRMIGAVALACALMCAPAATSAAPIQGASQPVGSRLGIDLAVLEWPAQGNRSGMIDPKPSRPSKNAQSAPSPKRLALAGSRPKKTDRNSVTVPLDAARAPLPTPPVSTARGANRPLVVIDAGHGGHDPGSISVLGGRYEKDVALAIARAIRDELVASGRVRVALTRDDDRFLVLAERREIARRMKADLFISVHADSAANKEARGATVYTLSEVASDKVAAQLAAKENKADILNGVNLGGETADVSSILIELAQRETMNVSSDFAALLQREMSPRIAFRTAYHRFANLMVLKAPDVPSVLLETGYVSNEEDARLLFSRDYQKNVAIGVRRAIEAHFARRLAQR